MTGRTGTLICWRPTTRRSPESPGSTCWTPTPTRSRWSPPSRWWMPTPVSACPSATSTGHSASASSTPSATTSVARWGWPTRSSSIQTLASPTWWRRTPCRCRRWWWPMPATATTLFSRTTTCSRRGPMPPPSSTTCCLPRTTSPSARRSTVSMRWSSCSTPAMPWWTSGWIATSAPRRSRWRRRNGARRHGKIICRPRSTSCGAPCQNSTRVPGWRTNATPPNPRRTSSTSSRKMPLCSSLGSAR